MSDIKLSEADEAFIQESERRMPDDGPMSHPNDEPWMVISSEKVRAYLASRPSAPVAQALSWGDFLRCVTLACNGAIASDDLDECIKALRYIRGCVGEYLKGNPSGSVPAPQPEAGPSVDVETLRVALRRFTDPDGSGNCPQCWEPEDKPHADGCRVKSGRDALARQLSAAQVPRLRESTVHVCRNALQHAQTRTPRGSDSWQLAEDALHDLAKYAALPAQPQEQSAERSMFPPCRHCGLPLWREGQSCRNLECVSHQPRPAGADGGAV